MSSNPKVTRILKFGESVRLYIYKNPSVLANLGIVEERYHATQLGQHMEWLYMEGCRYLGDTNEFVRSVLGKFSPTLSLNARREELHFKLARTSCFLQENGLPPLWIPAMEIQDYAPLALILSHYLLMGGDLAQLHDRMGVVHQLLRPITTFYAVQLVVQAEPPHTVMISNTQNGQVMTLMEWLFYEAMYGNPHRELVHFAACCLYNMLTRVSSIDEARKMVSETDPHRFLMVDGVYFVVVHEKAKEEEEKQELNLYVPPLPVIPFAIQHVLPASTREKQQLLTWLELRLYHRLEMRTFLSLFSKQ